MHASDYLEEVIVEWLRGNATAAPAALYLALYTSDPTDADTGTEVVVAREEIELAPILDGRTSNTNSITFDSLPAGEITHVGIRDADVAGNLLTHAELSSGISVEAGESISWAPGEIDLTVG